MVDRHRTSPGNEAEALGGGANETLQNADLANVPPKLRPHVFKPGGPPGPGRPRGNEAAKVAQMVFAVVGEDANKQKLRKHLQAAFDRSPLGFLRRYVYPLIPRNGVSIATDGQAVAIKIVSGVDGDRL